MVNTETLWASWHLCWDREKERHTFNSYSFNFHFCSCFMLFRLSSILHVLFACFCMVVCLLLHGCLLALRGLLFFFGWVYWFRFFLKILFARVALNSQVKTRACSIIWPLASSAHLLLFCAICDVASVSRLKNHYLEEQIEVVGIPSVLAQNARFFRHSITIFHLSCEGLPTECWEN